MTEISLFSAFIMGLLGSSHCIVMCGGVASSLQLASKANFKPWHISLLYNFGRLISYAIAGTVVAALGLSFAKQNTVLANTLQLLSGVFLLLVGVYVMRLASTLQWLESIGKKLIWQHIVKLNTKLLPVDTRTKAILYGALWGWLPCGLVYSALTWTLQAKHPLEGALIMIAFALGTLPAMFAVGQSAQLISTILNHKLARLCFGNIFVWYGVYLVIIVSDKLVH